MNKNLDEIKECIAMLTTKKVLLPTLIVSDILFLIFVFAIWLIVNIFASLSYFVVFFAVIFIDRIYQYMKYSLLDDDKLTAAGNILNNMIDYITDTAEGK